MQRRFHALTPIFDQPIQYGVVESGGTPGFAVPRQRVLGAASETDSARPIPSGHRHALVIASETDSAVTVTRAHQRAIGVGSETDTALTIGRRSILAGAWAHSSGSGPSPQSTLNWPKTPAVGDVALIFMTKSNFNPFGAHPSITDFGAPLHADDLGAVYSRVVDGTETLTGYTVAVGGSQKHCSIMILISGLAGFTDVGWAVQSAVSSPTDIKYPTITPSAQPSLIFYTSHAAIFGTGSTVSPGGSNPTPSMLTDSEPSRTGAATCRSVIWTGACTSTSALGDRTVAETGLDGNYYQGMTFGIAV